LVMQGIQPGPQVIATNPELFWGLIASMWIGNCILLILNLPMIGIWVKVLQVPRIILFPVIVSACLYGAYSLNNNMFDVWMLIPFTLLGYLLKWLDINPTPMALGFIVGPLLEETFRRSLIISQGNWDTFVQSPISISILSITAVSILVKLYTASASSKYKK
jgi:putative tricarboxylic transport membrane protein